MKDVEAQKLKLEQKKNRIAAEEIRIKIKERKMRTRRLIELGGLVAKANLDFLETNTLYGAILSISMQLDSNPNIRNDWTKIGKAAFEKEDAITTPVILKFVEQPELELRKSIRDLGLKWNKFRKEWYGEITDLDKLTTLLKHVPHHLENLSTIQLDQNIKTELV